MTFSISETNAGFYLFSYFSFTIVYLGPETGARAAKIYNIFCAFLFDCHSVLASVVHLWEVLIISHKNE